MNIPLARLITAGVATLIAGLIILFPARVAYQWFAPPTVALSGIGGSVWHGRANQVQADGIYLSDLSWQFKPLSVFTGKAAFAVSGSPVSGFVDTTIAFGISGSINLKDLRGSLPLQAVEQLAGMPGLRGSVNVQFERLTLDNGLPVAADGELAVADLVAPLVNPASIGGFRAEFFTQSSGVMASVEDTDAVVDLAGTLEIRPDRNYQFIALIAPKASTPARLRQQMQFLGTANERGQYELRLEGAL